MVVVTLCTFSGAEGFGGNVALNIVMVMALVVSVAVIPNSLLQLRRAKHP